MHKILITGSSGFIGKAACAYFKEKGYEVHRLVRNPQQKAIDTTYWNPINEEIHLDELEGFYGVINLAGENITQGRWNEKKKEAIFLSRARHTWLLSHALSRLKRPPKVFFSASAIGFYGNRGDELLTEESRCGKGFLADVCAKWEEAPSILEQKVRVIRGRLGIVLDLKGGFLQKVLPVFRWGLGGKISDGKQWMSWIALTDVIRAIEFALHQKEIKGVVNLTSPHPVTNEEFTRLLAAALHRPALVPVPAWVLKLVYGEMAGEFMLASTRVLPKRLENSGFIFETPMLAQLLSSC